MQTNPTRKLHAEQVLNGTTRIVYLCDDVSCKEIRKSCRTLNNVKDEGRPYKEEIYNLSYVLWLSALG